jgi:hypothetical protein
MNYNKSIVKKSCHKMLMSAILVLCIIAGTMTSSAFAYAGSMASNLPVDKVTRPIPPLPMEDLEFDAHKCGENATWELKDGVLTISGTGDMYDYTQYHTGVAPWDDSRFFITKVVIEEGITKIGSGAFCDCDNLANVTIPKSVTSIGSMAFFGCEKLSNVTIPASVTNIGYGAFDQCEMLSEITIDRTEAPKISFCTFGTNKNTKLFVPAGSVSYDTGYWVNYTVVYGDNVSGQTSIPPKPEDRFRCGDNARWELEEGVLTISGTGSMDDYVGGQAPWDSLKNTLTDIVVEDGITKIGTGVFQHCKNLETVSISNSVSEIASLAFFGCDSLENITIPASVEKIGFGVFSGCDNLKSVTMDRLEAPEISRDAFGANKNLRIFVPKGAKGYESGNWSEYTIIYK